MAPAAVWDMNGRQLHLIDVTCQEQSHLSIKRRSEANSWRSEGKREGIKKKAGGKGEESGWG